MAHACANAFVHPTAVMSTVFLCHASQDKKLLRRIANDLRQHAVEVWFDEERIRVGDSLRESVEGGLERADYVLIALSRSAARSAWVRRELSAAFAIEASRRRTVILPILVEQVSLPPFLRDKKYADFSRNYAKGLRELLHALAETPPQQQYGLETNRCRIYVDLVRCDGSLARYHKRQIQTCLSDGISLITEAYFSDGVISHFRTSPGRIRRIWREMNATWVEVMLSRSLRKGEKIVRTLDCLYERSFLATSELWEQVQHHPSRNLEIAIRFPKSRPPKTWQALEKRGPDRIPLPSAKLRVVVDRKPALRLFVRSPRILSSYVIEWTW